MCKWGTDVVMPLEIPADLSHSGEAYIKSVGVDACLAPIVKALNDAGVKTRACCCGHGKGCGHIALVDGRVLLIYPSRADAESALDAFEPETVRPLVNEETIDHAVTLFNHGATRRRAIRAVMKYTLRLREQTGCGCEHFPCDHTPPHRRKQ